MNERYQYGPIAYGMLTIILVIAGFLLVDNEVVYTKPDEYSVKTIRYNYSVNIPDVIGYKDNTLVTKEIEKQSYIDRYSLPKLRRLSKSDQQKYITDTLLNKRVKALKINSDEVLLPEKKWKSLYIESFVTLEKYDEVKFNGNKTSELNTFIKNNPNKTIVINNAELQLDKTLVITSNSQIIGAPTKLIASEGFDTAINIQAVENIYISDLEISNVNTAIKVKDSSNLIVTNNIISDCLARAVIVTNGKNVNIVNNTLTNNEYGLCLTGDLNNSIIQSNTIKNTKNSKNSAAGIFIDGANQLDKEKSAAKKPINERLESPHNIIIYGNYIAEGNSSGIYCCGPYQIYVIKNNITSNEKEGICLDWGTIGSYVSENNISYNGFRMHQSDDDLKQDYIFDFGRLDDGSSPAKLPGISLDNAMWNIISNNNINNNAGSGIKTVRSTIENIIIENNIIDNNMGSNKKFHFFGVELGAALESKEVENLKEIMDIIGNYENIITNNNISGKHYSGIFIQDNSYSNYFSNNTIMNPQYWSMESISSLANTSVNNYSNFKSRGIPLSNKNSIEIANSKD